MLREIYNWDLETFINCFLFIGKFEGSTDVQVFEISFRKNQRGELLQWLSYLKARGVLMQGFNSKGFDELIIDVLYKDPTFSALTAYQKAQEIITSQFSGVRVSTIHHSKSEIAQLDLMLLHHFNNKARATRLKDLQFAMRSATLEDLPFSPHEPLTSEQIDALIKYGIHDVTETEQFGIISKPLVELRQELMDAEVLSGDVLNYSDVKIGEKILVSRIGRNKCYKGSQPIQTHEHSITNVREVLLDKIYFREPDFQEVHEWFKNLVINVHAETKPKFIKNLGGIDFHFGLGGVHASVDAKVFHSTETHQIIDVDVAGMYVAVAIANGFAPKHLGDDFRLHYKALQTDRARYKKGTSMNKALKLAGNGVYGKSNDIFSPFYDPRYTWSVTCNGQLQALQLAERFASIKGLQLIQANTDGITALVPRDMIWLFEFHKTEWEKETLLKLEEAKYKSMHVRDVNNYIAVYEDGKMKTKGAYWYPETIDDYEGNWHKDFSMMVVPKVAALCQIHGWDPATVIKTWTDPFDFMKREKNKGQTRMFIGDEETTRTVRYYVSTAGQPAHKTMPPQGPIGTYKRKSGLKDSEYNRIALTIPEGTWDARIHTANKKTYTERTTSVDAGFKLVECNIAKKFNWTDVDVDYYVSEVNKLLIKG